MPFLYRTEIRQSQIHGKGVFALEDIPQGETYWVCDTLQRVIPTVGYPSQKNIIYSQTDLQSIKDLKELIPILHGGFYYKDGDLFIELRDGAHFMNHSDDANSQMVYNKEKDYKKIYSYASKHIKAGEEITESYGNYQSENSPWLSKLMYEHLPERMAVQNSISNRNK